MIGLVADILSAIFGLAFLFLCVIAYAAVAHWRERRAQRLALKNAVETQNYHIREVRDWDGVTRLKITMPQLHGERIIKICPEGKIKTPMWWFGGTIPPRSSSIPGKRWCKQAEKYTGQMAVMHKLKQHNEE